MPTTDDRPAPLAPPNKRLPNYRPDPDPPKGDLLSWVVGLWRMTPQGPKPR